MMNDTRRRWLAANKDKVKQDMKRFYERHPNYNKNRFDLSGYHKKWIKSDHASIYVIVNKHNNKVYVGSTTINPVKHWWNHLRELQTGNKRPLYADMRKYTSDDFEMIIMSEHLKPDAFYYEQCLMDEYTDKGIELYNIHRAMSLEKFLEYIPKGE